MNNGQAGKGDTFRKVDGDKYRKNYDRIFGKQESKKMTSSDNNTQSFGDIDKHQLKKGVFDRLRAVLVGLARHYTQDYGFTRKLQEFGPQLKRTDKDHGSLPFYSKEYTSVKANRDHCILCVISKAVQDYWDFYDDTIEDAELVLFFKQIGILEAIVTEGFASYRVTGKVGRFYLDTILNIEAALAAEENPAAAEEEQAEVEADKLAEETVAETVGSEEFEAAEAAEDEANENFTETGQEKVSEESTSKGSSSIDARSDDSDQLSTELADQCSSDCDTCENKVCETAEAKDIPAVPEEEDVTPLDDSNIDIFEGEDQGDDDGVDDNQTEQPEDANDDGTTRETEEERRQAQDDAGEPYPDQEKLS